MKKIITAILFLAVSLPVFSATIYQAENGALNGTNVSTALAGYQGSGYVDGFDAAGDYCQVTVNVATAGMYTVTIGFAGTNGPKVNDLYANGVLQAAVSFPATSGFQSMTAGMVPLNAGNNTLRIQNNWGWFYLDWFGVEAATLPVLSVPDTLVNTASSNGTKCLMKYLAANYGNYTISGQCGGADVTWINTATAHYPAVQGFDMMDYSPSRVAHGAPDPLQVEAAIAWYQAGGIVQFQWHWNAPMHLIDGADGSGYEWWRGFYTYASTFDVQYAMNNTGSPEYAAIVSDIDAIAVQLERLQAAGVPVIWRPLHEAQGGWFWWGAQGYAACMQLYALVYDRLKNYHAINNLIWTWTTQDNAQSASWYPGNTVVDIVGADIYLTGLNYSPSTSMFYNIVNMTGGNKIVAMTETGTIPDADLMAAQHAHWAYFLTWNGFENDIAQNSLAHVQAVYNHSYIITRDELSGVYACSLGTPTFTPSSTRTATFTSTRTDTSTFTRTNTPTYTSSIVPSSTVSSSGTATFTRTDTPANTQTFTATPSGTFTRTPSPSATFSESPSSTDTRTPSATATSTGSVLPTSSVSSSNTDTRTPTFTRTLTSTRTPTPTKTDSPDYSPTETSTGTPPTATVTPTISATASVSPSSSNTKTPTETETELPTDTELPTETITPAMASTATQTPTIPETPNPTPSFTPGPGAECVMYHIDRSALPAAVFMRKLTVKAHVGDCSSTEVYVDGVFTASTYDPAAKTCMFTTAGTDVIIFRNNYTGGATYAAVKQTLYEGRKWAYSFTFDDARPSANAVALPILESYGYKAGVALSTQQMQATTNGYVMSWATADNLRAHGWSFFDHNYSHLAATCGNISTETVPVKNAIEARWPGYINTHFVYPYVNTSAWTCIRDSGLFLSAEVYNGNNYADTLAASPFLLNRNSMMSAGNAGTTALANAMADNAAADPRPRWMIMFTHDVAPGSTAPGSVYDTNEAVFSPHIAYVYNTYGAGGLNNVWFAPTDEVMQYIMTRQNAVVTLAGTGACGSVTPVTPTFTRTPSPTPTITPTPDLTGEFKITDPVIFPNPCNPGKGPLNVRLKLTKPAVKTALRIYTSGFRRVMDLDAGAAAAGDAVITINTGSGAGRLASGLYFIVIEGEAVTGEKAVSKPEELVVLK